MITFRSNAPEGSFANHVLRFPDKHLGFSSFGQGGHSAGVQTMCVLLGPARLTDVGQLLFPDSLQRDLAVVLEEVLVIGSIICAVLGTDPPDLHTRSFPSECSRSVSKCLDKREEGVCRTVEGLVVVKRRRRFAVQLYSLRGAIDLGWRLPERQRMGLLPRGGSPRCRCRSPPSCR